MELKQRLQSWLLAAFTGAAGIVAERHLGLFDRFAEAVDKSYNPETYQLSDTICAPQKTLEQSLFEAGFDMTVSISNHNGHVYKTFTDKSNSAIVVDIFSNGQACIATPDIDLRYEGETGREEDSEDDTLENSIIGPPTSPTGEDTPSTDADKETLPQEPDCLTTPDPKSWGWGMMCYEA